MCSYHECHLLPHMYFTTLTFCSGVAKLNTFFEGFLVTTIDSLVASSIELKGTCMFNGPWGSGKQSRFPSHLKDLNRSINNNRFKIKRVL